MKVGDLVICNCASDVWYKGKVGVVIEYSTFSKNVLIEGKVLELAGISLEKVTRS